MVEQTLCADQENNLKYIGLTLLVLISLAANISALEPGDVPVQVSVLPVFYVPRGEELPTREQIDFMVKHLEITQAQYKRMLKNRSTFAIANIPPLVVTSNYTLAKLKSLQNGIYARYVLRDIFRKLEVNRFNCPYVFATIVMSNMDSWPRAGGRPLNGGFNNGGGIALFSTKSILTPNSTTQGGLLHELGHAFGLVHIKCYDYDQYSNKSIMSYNKENYWRGFTPPDELPVIQPEELRTISMNQRVFPGMYFDKSIDVTDGYTFVNKLSRLSHDMKIIGEKEYEIKTHTNSGCTDGSKPDNIVHGYIKPNNKRTGFKKDNMWKSEKDIDGWIDLELTFPIEVNLTRITVLSQCSGDKYPVTSIKVQPCNNDIYKTIGEVQESDKDQQDVIITPTKAKKWKLLFRPDQSGQVVIRGLRFYSEKCEIFCQKYPTYLLEKGTWKVN